MARPKTTYKDLRPDWKDCAHRLYRAGAGNTEVYVRLGLTERTFYNLLKRDKVFKKAIDQGKKLSLAWWEKKGRKNLHNNKFNTTLFKFMMSAKFGWSEDKKEKKTENLILVSGVLSTRQKPAALEATYVTKKKK